MDEPRYQILETKTSAMKKKLQFMATASTPTNADGISFYYEFVPEGSIAGADDPLFGKESKAWILDNESAGYMGCGGSLGNPTEWWSAQPHEKDDKGVTDDRAPTAWSTATGSPTITTSCGTAARTATMTPPPRSRPRPTPSAPTPTATTSSFRPASSSAMWPTRPS